MAKFELPDDEEIIHYPKEDGIAWCGESTSDFSTDWKVVNCSHCMSAAYKAEKQPEVWKRIEWYIATGD